LLAFATVRARHRHWQRQTGHVTGAATEAKTETEKTEPETGTDKAKPEKTETAAEAQET